MLSRAVFLLIILLPALLAAGDFRSISQANGVVGFYDLFIPYACSPCCNSTSEFTVKADGTSASTAWFAATGPWVVGPGNVRLWCDGNVIAEAPIANNTTTWNLFHAFKVTSSSCSVTLCGEISQEVGISTLMVITEPVLKKISED